MTALEQQIFEGVQELDEQEQQQVLQLIHQLRERKAPASDWLERLIELRKEIAADHPEGFYFNSVNVLNEVREERLNDLMGRG